MGADEKQKETLIRTDQGFLYGSVMRGGCGLTGQCSALIMAEASRDPRTAAAMMEISIFFISFTAVFFLSVRRDPSDICLYAAKEKGGSSNFHNFRTAGISSPSSQSSGLSTKPAERYSFLATSFSGS